VHVGFLTEESGDVFSPKVLKGGPLGEMVQWADILTTLHVLGHNLKISLSVKELQGWVMWECCSVSRSYLIHMHKLTRSLGTIYYLTTCADALQLQCFDGDIETCTDK